MKKIQYQYRVLIMATVMSLLLASCSKQLNVYPTTTEVDGKLITDLTSAKTALNGVYYRFAAADFDFNNNPTVKWYKINEDLPSTLSGMFTYPYGGSSFADHNYAVSESFLIYIWKYGMDIVNASNGFLKNLASAPQINPEMKAELAAEAKFLRAYANATLLAFYGQYESPDSKYGNILRKAFVNSDNIVLGRSTVQETYDFILSDLDDAIAALPLRNTTNFYANQWAAKLLKARVLMLRNQASDKATVISLCKDIISKGGYTLEASSKDLFLNKGLQSNEVILGVQPYTQDIGKFSNYQTYRQDVATDLMLTLFSTDPRKDWIYRRVKNPYGDSMEIITKYFPGSVANPVSSTIANTSYAFRLTEAYLLEAEAITESGQNLGTAKTLLKTVMGKAGVTDFAAIEKAETAAQLQRLVIEEEMRNFVGEAGQDWFALRRLPFKTVQSMVPTITSEMLFVLPIPKDEIKRNRALKGMQNPGYPESY